MKEKINHALADTISIIKEVPGGGPAYCDAFSSEIAFFRNGEWVTDIIPEFADYTDGVNIEDTIVYCYVPDSKIIDFLKQYAIGLSNTKKKG